MNPQSNTINERMELSEESADSILPVPIRAEKRTRPTRFVIALLVVVILVVAGLASVVTFGWGPFGRPPASTAPGPGLYVNFAPGTPAATGTTTVQVFAYLPATQPYLAANLTGLSALSNPYLDELFRGTSNASGNFSGNLSSAFFAVDSAWLASPTPLVTNVSLQMFATLNVLLNGTDEVYTYSNNLPFNPHAPPAAFRTTVTFSSPPMFSVPGATSPALVPASAGPPPGCQPGYYWAEVNQTNMPNSDLPLVTVNVGGAPTGSTVAYGLFYSSGTFEVSFNSNTAYSSAGPVLSGVQMSSSPAASATQTNFQQLFLTSDAINSPGLAPVSMIALTGVNLVATNYRYHYVSSTCSDTALDHWMTTLVPTGLTGSAFVFGTPTLPDWFPQVMASEADWASFATVPLPWGGAGFYLYQVMRNASGYSNAESAYQSDLGFLSALTTNIGIAIAASGALGLLPGDGGASAVADIALLAAVAGYTAKFLTMTNTVSYSTTERLSIESCNVDQPGVGADLSLTAHVNAQTAGTQLSLSSGTFYPDMPLTWVQVT